MPDSIEARLRESLGDRYHVVRELGAGGMALVYLAEDRRHGRQVAVKVLRPETAATIGPDRFLREIRLAAGLQHPNILGLIDSGDAGGLPYYVMPYIDGRTLRVRLARDGELKLDEAVRLLRELADALSYAHARGVVHRDVKPENVLFSAGHAQLADFGVAKAIGDAGLGAGSATTMGVVIGSPAYMAPEQVSGDPAVDHRADIYGLGVVAYEALSGQHPFGAASAREMMTAHLTRTPPPLGRVRPGVPAELSAAIMRCLEKRAADRWQTAGDLVHCLDDVLATVAGTSAPGPAHDVAPARFRLTEPVCRKLSRGGFNPRMIGDEMEYLDNGVRSGTLVCFLHGFGLDASDFEPHLRMLPCRGIAPTMYGFEPLRRRRFSLPLDDHFVLLRELLRDVARRTGSSTVVLAGFSSGADVALQLAAAAGDAASPIDGVLALSANLSLETCFVTRRLSTFERGRESDALRELRGISEHADSLDEWLDVNAYLVRMLRKFQWQTDPLRQFGRDVVRPFDSGGPNPFIRWYHDAGARGALLRCVFEDTETCGRPLRDIQLQHTDARVLGDAYREESLLVEPDTHHFDLMDPELIARHLATLLAHLRGDERRTTNGSTPRV